MRGFFNRFWPEVLLLAACVLFLAVMCGCNFRMTPEAETAAKAAGGAVATIFGMPPALGVSVVGLITSAISAFAGHHNGKRVERKKQKNITKVETKA
jgi:hypothetical protein